MKIFPFLLAIFVFTACQKNDELSLESELSSKLEMSARSYSGMLELPDAAAAQKIQKQLRETETFSKNKNELYHNIGIDIESEEIQNVTRHPLCLKFEQESGYISKRRAEENHLNEQLNNGGEVNNIVADPYWKTLLNEDNAIKIGKRIFKFYDSGLVAIIANSDLATYERIKDLDEMELTEGFNLRLEGKGDENKSSYYQVDAEGEIAGPKHLKDYRFVQSPNPDNSISISNQSFVEYSDGSSPNYTWTYADGSTSEGREPSRTFQEGEQVSVKIGNASNSYEEQLISPLACAVHAPYISIIRLSGTTYRFDYPQAYCLPYAQGGYHHRWIFGDGNTSYCSSPATHTYASGLAGSTVTVRLEFLRNSGGTGQGTVGCYASVPHEIDALCEGERRVSATQEFPKYNGKRYRILVALWVNEGTWFSWGNVGAESAAQRKRLFGWRDLTTTSISLKIRGSYFIEQSGACNIRNINITQSAPSATKTTSLQSESGIERRDPGNLFSEHWFVTDNKTFRYTNSGGQLTLF